eukprot:TRINITY_DN7449_c0_g1_i1.p1 TRINITY_DN7449_c0_g1~~TRINITY_DN7449_c0_g1_i1.p1  ORF type:complete len:358 (-),score=91.52 TRINITY_DN7449_c0_g1_i1:57-1130(-)
MKRGGRGASFGGASSRGGGGGSGWGGATRGSWGGAQRAATVPMKTTVEQKQEDLDSDSDDSSEEQEKTTNTTTPVKLAYVPQKARPKGDDKQKQQRKQEKPQNNNQNQKQQKQQRPTAAPPVITTTDEQQTFDFGDGARVVYYPHFLDKPTADMMFEDFLKTIPWDAKDVYVDGIGWVPQPRLVAWMSSDKTFEYTYNNLTLQPKKPTPLLIDLQRRIERVTPGCQYDGTLINLYRNGKDSIAAHSDAEDTLVVGSTIASISLGCERSFILRPKHKVGSPTEIKVKHGSLLLMEGTLQKHYVHEVPKDFKLCLTHYGPDKYGLCDCPHTKRINLTMRHYKPPSSSSHPRKYAIKITE